jgi:hypothetical protein
VTHDLDEQLATELGGAAYRMPAPPLAAVRERAARRRRGRATRRVVGAAAAAVLVAGAVAVLTDDAGTKVAPADRRPPLSRATMCGGKTPDLTPAAAGPVLRLPARAPLGLPYGQPYLYAEKRDCDYLDLVAWTEDPATRRITRWLETSSTPYRAEPGKACDRFDGDGQMPGTCREVDIAGESRDVLWSDAEPGPAVRWLDDDDRLWTVFSYGFDELALRAALADFRLSDGHVESGSLPRGMDVWLAPTEMPADDRILSTWYGDRTAEVFFGVHSSPLSDPFTQLRGWSYEPGTRLEVVEVDGRPGYWRESGEAGEGPDNELTWRGEDGVTLSLSGDRLTKAEALAVAGSVRPVSPDDERLVEPPPPTG